MCCSPPPFPTRKLSPIFVDDYARHLVGSGNHVVVAISFNLNSNALGGWWPSEVGVRG